MVIGWIMFHNEPKLRIQHTECGEEELKVWEVYE